MSKRWMRAVLISLVALLICCVLVVFIADPFQAYRMATWYTPAYDNGEQAYFNAGLARHSDYDAVFMGTSMVENTRVSQVDEVFGTNCIKLPFENGMACNHAAALSLAFDTHTLTHVFYGLDMYSFINKPGFSKFAMPAYLYDNDPLDDVSYLLNGDVLLHRIPAALIRKQQGTQPEAATRDTIYAWGLKPGVTYGEEAVMQTYNFKTPAVDMLPADTYAKNVEENFNQYLKPFIEGHPDTKFIFFYPPYSALQWYMMQQQGHLDAILNTKEQLTDLLLAYPNVQLHDFSANQDWIEDYSLYTDYSHYGPQVNEWIVDALATEDFLVKDIYDVYDNDDALNDIVANFAAPQ